MLLATEALLPNLVPALSVNGFVFLDVIFVRVQGEVRGVEGEDDHRDRARDRDRRRGVLRRARDRARNTLMSQS